MPPRKPTALKVLNGSAAHHPERRNRAEPEPPLVEVGAQPPAWLTDKRARAYWPDAVALLTAQRILAVTDTTALGLLCVALADYVEAAAIVAKKGLTYATKTATGSEMVRANPAVAIRDDAWRRLRAILADFGATPASRPRVAALPLPADERESEMARLLTPMYRNG